MLRLVLRRQMIFEVTEAKMRILEFLVDFVWRLSPIEKCKFNEVTVEIEWRFRKRQRRMYSSVTLFLGASHEISRGSKCVHGNILMCMYK